MKQNITAVILAGGFGTRYNKNSRRKILKPLVNKTTEIINPNKPQPVNIPQKESLFKRTVKKIKEFSPFKRFMSKGGKPKKNYQTFKRKKTKCKSL